MTKRMMLLFLISILFVSQSVAADKPKDMLRSFYDANSLYEKGDYTKAVEEYLNIVDMGLESGNLYYNIGNGFLKLGKIGYAILCYKKAERFIPGDSDLRSNFGYAKALTEDLSPSDQTANILIRALKRPFKDFNLNALAISVLIFYLVVTILLLIFIINPILARRMKFILFVCLAVFSINAAAFAIRYYDEQVLVHGIIIQKAADCKYEPIDKATTYYVLHEGNEVIILETRNGWRQIKRSDGKIAWVKKEAVEEI